MLMPLEYYYNLRNLFLHFSSDINEFGILGIMRNTLLK